MPFLTFEENLHIGDIFDLEEAKQQPKSFFNQPLTFAEKEISAKITKDICSIFEKNLSEKTNDRTIESLLNAQKEYPNSFLYALLNERFSNGVVLIEAESSLNFYIKVIEVCCVKEVFQHFKEEYSSSFLIGLCLVRKIMEKLCYQLEKSDSSFFTALKSRMNEENYKYFLLFNNAVIFNGEPDEKTHSILLPQEKELLFLKSLSYEELNFITFRFCRRRLNDDHRFNLIGREVIREIDRSKSFEKHKFLTNNLCLTGLNVQVLHDIAITNQPLKAKLKQFKDKLVKQDNYYHFLVSGEELCSCLNINDRRYIAFDPLYSLPLSKIIGRPDKFFGISGGRISEKFPFIFNGKFIKENNVLDAIENLLIFFMCECYLSHEQRLVFLSAHRFLILEIAKFLLTKNSLDEGNQMKNYIYSKITLGKQRQGQKYIKEVFLNLYMKCYLNKLITEKLEIDLNNIFEWERSKRNSDLERLYIAWGLYFIEEIEDFPLIRLGNHDFQFSSSVPLIRVKNKLFALFVSLGIIFDISQDKQLIPLTENRLDLHIDVVYQLLKFKEVRENQNAIAKIQEAFKGVAKLKNVKNLSLKNIEKTLKNNKDITIEEKMYVICKFAKSPNLFNHLFFDLTK